MPATATEFVVSKPAGMPRAPREDLPETKVSQGVLEVREQAPATTDPPVGHILERKRDTNLALLERRDPMAQRIAIEEHEAAGGI